NGPNGVEVIAQLREKFQHEIPAIVITGDISTQTLRAIADVGSTHLDKPVETAELLRVVTNLLAASTPMATLEPAVRASRGLSPGTIFVVDDDPRVRDAVREMLESHGWDVETFNSCEGFLGALLPGRHGCLVIDAVLPGMNGFKLLTRLKADSIALPSIMITGHGDVSMAVRVMRAGASDFIEKPFGHEELLASIKHALEQTPESAPEQARRMAATAHLEGLTTRQRQFSDSCSPGIPARTSLRIWGSVSERWRTIAPPSCGKPDRGTFLSSSAWRSRRIEIGPNIGSGMDTRGCLRKVRSSCGRRTLSSFRGYVQPPISSICSQR